MSNPCIAIRVDSGTLMGSGHLMRCLTLANELRRRGARVHFITREHGGHLTARVDGAGHRVHRLAGARSGTADVRNPASWLAVPQDVDAEESLSAMGDAQFDCLIVDHYAINEIWERRFRSVVGRLVVIDDLANRSHDADLILDQNYFGHRTQQRYADLVPDQCRKLLGPRYALVQPVYAQLRKLLAARDGAVHRVLLFLGAYDVSCAVLKVLAALDRPDLAHLSIDFVPGDDPEILASAVSIAETRGNLKIHQGLPSLAGLMMRADLAIGASGTTTWERACLGLPALVTTIADNQLEVAEALAAGGFIALAGPSSALTEDDWAREIRGLIADSGRVALLGQRALELTDGLGVARVAAAVLCQRAAGISIRKATSSDEALLLDWANDPDVRRMGFHKERITFESHHRWFTARLADPHCMILIGEDGYGLPIGQIRFDVEADQQTATIGVSVEPALRGLGLGARFLRDALEFWRARMPGLTVVADVLPENESSRRLFQAAGFTSRETRRPGSLAFEQRP